jgi:hypothetical protein
MGHQAVAILALALVRIAMEHLARPAVVLGPMIPTVALAVLVAHKVEATVTTTSALTLAAALGLMTHMEVLSALVVPVPLGAMTMTQAAGPVVDLVSQTVLARLDSSC